MSQGKGKASSSRRRSSDGHPYDDRPRLSLPRSSFKDMYSDIPPPVSATSSSYFDASIPLNLPPRRSMKMLKDGSDFVWPDAAHALFVRGLQAWKYINIGNKRTRAPRGEGKTDFLVRYLHTQGVQRTKKQVASHLQVLRTEWRNLDNTILLSLVDDTAPHKRSLSEPSLPPPPISSNSSPSTSRSAFDPSPDLGDDRAISMPQLPSPISTLPPPSGSSLFHPAHDIYSVRPHSYPETVANDPFRAQQSSNLGSWQLDNTVWHTVVDRLPQQQEQPSSRPSFNYPVASYDPPSSFHDYDTTPSPMVSSPMVSRGFGPNYYGLSSLPSRGDPSSSVAPLPRGSQSLTSLPLEAGDHAVRAPMVSASSYNSYNNPAPYPLPQPAPHDVYGHASMSYGTEPYQTHFSGEPQHANPSLAPGMAGSAPYGVVEPDFLPDVQLVQPQWLRPPAMYPRSAETPERQDESPEP